MKSRQQHPRGVALVSALIVLAILLASVAGLMYYAGTSRGRAINITREAQRASCAHPSHGSGSKTARV